jgi:hypothetical protein
MSDCTGCKNLSNPTHQGTREMCRIVHDVRTCLTRHTKGPGKCLIVHDVRTCLTRHSKGPGYNNFYLFQWNICTEMTVQWNLCNLTPEFSDKCNKNRQNVFSTTNYFAIVQRINVIFFFTNGYLSLKFENFAVLSKSIHYHFDNTNFIR